VNADEIGSPALSIVIAAFNAVRTLGAQLEVLSHQAASVPVQILVCDNGSSDGTADLVREWMRRHSAIELVDASARRGPAAARNVGALHAQAPLLAFCDADDVVAEDWIATMYAAVRRDDFVAGVATRLRLGSSPHDPRYYEFGPYRISRFPHLLAAAANNLGVRRSVFEGVGGFDESLRTGEDDDLCWRIQLAGHRLVTHPEVTITAGARDGLPAIFAQGFGYGRGDRQLLHKYARIIAALENGGNIARGLVADDERLIDSRADEVPAGTGGRVARSVKRIARLRRPSDLADVAHRWGVAAGQRFGRLDRTAPQLDPERVLGGKAA